MFFRVCRTMLAWVSAGLELPRPVHPRHSCRQRCYMPWSIKIFRTASNACSGKRCLKVSLIPQWVWLKHRCCEALVAARKECAKRRALVRIAPFLICCSFNQFTRNRAVGFVLRFFPYWGGIKNGVCNACRVQWIQIEICQWIRNW